jgi:hypothetical protein
MERDWSTALGLLCIVGPLAYIIVEAISEGDPTPVILGIAGVGALVLALGWLGAYAYWLMSYVEPGTDGLIVRNILRRHHIQYSQIASVRVVRHRWLSRTTRDLCIDLTDGSNRYCVAFSGRANHAHEQELERVRAIVSSARERALQF